jgi:hypothetical protein
MSKLVCANPTDANSSCADTFPASIIRFSPLFCHYTVVSHET